MLLDLSSNLKNDKTIMKKSIIPSVIILIMSSFASVFAEKPEDSGIVLRGVLDMGSKQLFSVSTPGGSSKDWVELGGGFREFELVSYDAETQTLTVVRGDEELKVPMAGVSITSESAETVSKEERVAEARRIMDIMNFEEMFDKTLDAQMKGMTDMMRKQMQQAQGGKVDEELLDFQMNAMEEMFDGMDMGALKEGFIDIYAEVFTKDELAGIIEFYATPAGQASIEKQPEVQMKTMEVMTPMIMEASQTMQEKMMKFYQDRQAKAQEASTE